MKKSVSFALAATLSLGIIGGMGVNALADTAYTVQKGDCLWKIAKEYLGDGAKYTEIFEANRDLIKNPDKIYVGQVINIPDSQPAQEATEVTETPEVTEAPEEVAEEAPADVLPGVINPVTTCESLDELNELAGTTLIHPGVMGVTDEKFLVITAGEHKIAEYSYTIAGRHYVLRHCNDTLEDISGIYIDGKTAFQDREPADFIDYVNTDDMKLARWFRVEGQFVLCAENAADMSDEDFQAVAEETLMTNAIQTES